MSKTYPEEILDKIEKEEKQKPEPTEVTVYNCDKVYIRERPNKQAKVMCIVKANTKLKINGKFSGGWARVYTDKDVKGYIMTDYIKES